MAERRFALIGHTHDSTGVTLELSDLTDVNTSTPTNRFVLVADGVDWESRLLVEADISDLQAYLTSVQLSDNTDVTSATATDKFALMADGADYVGRALVEADISDLGTYLTTPITEGDITGAAFTNWDTAYGWGDHASGGYLTSTLSSDLSINNNVDLIFKTFAGGTDGTQLYRATGDATWFKYGGNSFNFEALGDHPFRIRSVSTSYGFVYDPSDYSLSLLGSISATSYGGITEANLVDKSATEIISGQWDFDAVRIKDNASFTLADTSNVSRFQYTSGSADFASTDGYCRIASNADATGRGGCRIWISHVGGSTLKEIGANRSNLATISLSTFP